MNALLRLLALFFRPAIDGGPQDPPADPDPKDPPADPDPQPELEFEADPADPEPEPRVAANEELEAERRARTADKERADRFEREAAELRARQSRPVADEETVKEDARLADPAVTDLEKWQIRSNRTIRANSSAAQAALAQAQDVRDQTAFNQLAITEPGLHKRYAVRVEQELAGARRAGFNPGREYIYNQLIAKDMREGKFKRKAADPAKPSVPRGKTPGARSDVPAKAGTMSNRERLAKKLDGVNI